MKTNFLKQAEIFAFLAMIFLISISYAEKKIENNPPIIILEDKHFRFPLGTAKITEHFRVHFEEKVLSKLEKSIEKFKCDIVDVIGHTDSTNVVIYANRKPNLDRTLIKKYYDSNMEVLIPGSNVDLGMMRAMNVVKMIQGFQKESTTLSTVQNFYPYSAGQMITSNNKITKPDAKRIDGTRRRIEIRLRRYQETINSEDAFMY